MVFLFRNDIFLQGTFFSENIPQNDIYYGLLDLKVRIEWREDA